MLVGSSNASRPAQDQLTNTIEPARLDDGRHTPSRKGTSQQACKTSFAASLLL